MSTNLHKLYYKDYFSGVDFSEGNINSSNNTNLIKRRNNALTSPNLLQTNVGNSEEFINKHCTLEVLYPGLATGVGIEHEMKIEGEFKLGLHFDWTTGMPVIYGSSVKGVLRSYFEDFYSPKDNQPRKKDAIDDIFEGGGKSIYNRDIFFDAVIVKPDSKKRILCSDSITPHKAGPLKNPTPITFMKIAPGCHIKFRFKLVDTKIGDKVLTAQDKLKIFEKILTTVGIGAKTNVGYGQLKSIN